MRIRRDTSASFGVACAVCTLVAGSARAQDEAGPAAPPPVERTPEPPPGALELGGHHFIIPASFPTSFVATYLGIRLGSQLYSAPGLPTSVGTFTPSTLAATTATDWAGIFARARFAEVLGSNVSGLVYSGAAFEANAEGGLLFRLLRVDKSGTQVSLRLSGEYSSGLSISIIPLLTQQVAPTVKTVLQGQLSELVRTPLSEWDAQGNIGVAQALGRCFSLQGYVGGGVSGAEIQPFDTRSGGRVSSSLTGAQFNAAAAFEADASPAKIPIAILAEYAVMRQASPLALLPLTSINFLQTFSLGVYYSGRPNLQLGLIGAAEVGLPTLSTSAGESATPHSLLGEFVLMYIW